MNIFGRKKLNIIVFGSDGMLGYDVYEMLRNEQQKKYTCVNSVIGIDRKDIEEHHLLSKQSLFSYLHDHDQCDVCINCVAMTDTNAAENTIEGKNLSYRLNALFPRFLADVCKMFKIKLIHISTDYVFSEYCSEPYAFNPYHDPFPINIYGMHKLCGEQFIQTIMKKGTYAILRTSWLYGQHNQKSFVHKFIKNAKICIKENRPIEVTENEISVPTSTYYVTRFIKAILVKNEYNPISHVVPNARSSGVSRLEFAQAIAEIYNTYLYDSSSTVNDPFQEIDTTAIHGVIRNNKLQPTFSAMCGSIISYDPEWCSDTNQPNEYWETCLKEFFFKHFNELRCIE